MCVATSSSELEEGIEMARSVARSVGGRCVVCFNTSDYTCRRVGWGHGVGGEGEGKTADDTNLKSSAPECICHFLYPEGGC